MSDATVFALVAGAAILIWMGIVWALTTLFERHQRRLHAQNASYARRLRRALTGWPR